MIAKTKEIVYIRLAHLFNGKRVNYKKAVLGRRVSFPGSDREWAITPDQNKGICITELESGMILARDLDGSVVHLMQTVRNKILLFSDQDVVQYIQGRRLKPLSDLPEWGDEN